jgi:DNA polymerase I-like protein with 3'-5' exonuclease and polymerase domains
MVHLITNYNYDWHQFSTKGVDIEKASMLDFLQWFKNEGKILQLDIETNVVEKLYDRDVYVVQIGSKDAGVDENNVEYGEQWIFDIPRMLPNEINTLKSVLSTKKKTWIIHNAAFEYTVLKMCFGVQLGTVLDTFLMSKINDNGIETPLGHHSLLGCVKRLSNMTMSKEEQTTFNGDPLTYDQITYAATDVAVMGDVYDKLYAAGVASNSLPTFALENNAVRAFGDIQVNGLLLDWDEWMINARIFTKELEEVTSELNDMLFEPEMYTDCIRLGLIQAKDEYFFRWNSIAFKREIAEIVKIQVKPTLAELGSMKDCLKAIANPSAKETEQLLVVKYLLNKQYSKLETYMITNYDQKLIDANIKILKDTVNFEWSQQIKRLQALQIIHPTLTSTSEKALSRLSSDIVRKYKEYATKSKLVSSFGESFSKYIEGDGKIRTSINQIVATGRISSKNPNLQNLPHVSIFRNPFKADSKDKRLVIADYSSQEVLIAATLAQEPAWLEGIQKGYDLHSYNASLIFNDWDDVAEDDCQFAIDKSECKCTTHKKYRTSSKTITFGLIYGMGVMTLAEKLEISKTEAKDLMSKFFKVFPAVDKFMDNSKQTGLNNLFIETAPPYLRRRNFDAPKDNKEEASIRRKSGNTVIQGTAADMVKLALGLIKTEIDTNPYWDDVQIKMQIHDEIICQASVEQAEEWSVKQIKIMEFAAQHILKHNYLKSTVIISDKWEK